MAAALAYRQGLVLANCLTGEAHDYTRRRGIAHRGFAFGAHALGWDAQTFCDALERAEKRKNSTVARDIEVSLPRELDGAQRRTLAEDFADRVARRYDAPVGYAVHDPDARSDQRNVHGHFLLSTRSFGEDGRLGKKLRVLDDWTRGPAEMVRLRLLWQDTCNEHLARAGLDARIAMGRLDDDEVRVAHLGTKHTAIERKARERAGECLDRTQRPVTEMLSDGRCATERGHRVADAAAQATPGRKPAMLERETEMEGPVGAFRTREASADLALASSRTDRTQPEEQVSPKRPPRRRRRRRTSRAQRPPRHHERRRSGTPPSASIVPQGRSGTEHPVPSAQPSGASQGVSERPQEASIRIEVERRTHAPPSVESTSPVTVLPTSERDTLLAPPSPPLRLEREDKLTLIRPPGPPPGTKPGRRAQAPPASPKIARESPIELVAPPRRPFLSRLFGVLRREKTPEDYLRGIRAQLERLERRATELAQRLEARRAERERIEREVDEALEKEEAERARRERAWAEQKPLYLETRAKLQREGRAAGEGWLKRAAGRADGYASLPSLGSLDPEVERDALCTIAEEAGQFALKADEQFGLGLNARRYARHTRAMTKALDQWRRHWNKRGERIVERILDPGRWSRLWQAHQARKQQREKERAAERELTARPQRLREQQRPLAPRPASPRPRKGRDDDIER